MALTWTRTPAQDIQPGDHVMATWQSYGREPVSGWVTDVRTTHGITTITLEDGRLQTRPTSLIWKAEHES